jgi:signal transduction histidine kinase
MRDDVERIHGAGQYLLRLVTMILDLSKLEAGRMQFNVKRHRLDLLLAAAIEAKRAIIDSSSNRATAQVDPGVSQLAIDSHRFAQVLEALIENAAQYTVNGTITVSARPAELRGEKAVSIAIEDTGQGIAADQLATLFETFTTTRDASDSRYGGTGLSLAVVHRLCIAMDGNLEVASVPGKGSTFTVTFPQMLNAER